MNPPTAVDILVRYARMFAASMKRQGYHDDAARIRDEIEEAESVLWTELDEDEPMPD